VIARLEAERDALCEPAADHELTGTG